MIDMEEKTYRRTEDRGSEFTESFNDHCWKAGYTFRGIQEGDRIEEIGSVRIHLAERCEEVKDI